MVVPISGIDIPADALEAPAAVREHYYLHWWVTTGLLYALCIARLTALDVFGAFNTGLVAFLGYYLVKDRCQKMSQCCVLYFGVLCLMNGFFDLLPLLASVQGRLTENTDSRPSEAGQKVYEVTVEKHPFFDQEMGDFYNYQSLIMCVAPFVQLLGSLVAWKSYLEYPTFLFADSDDEQASPRVVDDLSGGGGRIAGRLRWTQAGQRLGANRMSQPGAPLVPLFEGRGHRLAN